MCVQDGLPAVSPWPAALTDPAMATDSRTMSTAAHVIDLLTSPGTPAPTRLRLAAAELAAGPTPCDSPHLIAQLADVVNGPGGDERVTLALHVFDTAAAV
jgi:hypothetical protein